MSQILFIGYTKTPKYYECVIETTENINIIDKLKTAWLCLKDGYYLGPWKIIIEDKELFELVSLYIKDLFLSLDINYPNDIWYFICGKARIEHPTMKQLDLFLIEN